MKANKNETIMRSLCAVLALLMVLTSLPWIGSVWAADVPKDVYNQNFDDEETGSVGYRLGGWDIIANGEDSVVEIVDSQDASHGKVIKITQPGDHVNDVVLDYALPGTTGYTDALISFDIRMSAGAQLNHVGLRSGAHTNPRAFVTVKEGKLISGNGDTELTAYTEDVWYHVQIRAYKDTVDGNQYYDIWVNDVMAAQKVTPYDNAALKGIVIHVSKWSAATVMVDNIKVTQTLAAPYTAGENFNGQTENANIDTLTGWTTRVSGTNATTATITDAGNGRST